MQTTYDPDKRKILSAVSHGSIFLNTLILFAGIPLAIMLVSEDPVVKDNAKEALNFHFNMWLYGIIFGILAWVLIGLPLLLILAGVQVVMPIVAIVHCLTNTSSPYRYPFIFRIL